MIKYIFKDFGGAGRIMKKKIEKIIRQKSDLPRRSNWCKIARFDRIFSFVKF